MPNTAPAAALRELQRGHQPVAIPLNAKGPKTPQWHLIRHTPESIPHTFVGKNIGLLLGTPSNGLVDVDLDCAEAATVAAVFLPRTGMVAGRYTRPRTHHFYRDRQAGDLLQCRDPRDGKMLVELRSSDGSKGVQTVIPPSVHPDGETYVWDEDGDPAEVDGPTLQRAVRKVAAAALLARCFPESRRHEFCLALAGGLLRRGWDSDAAHEFVYAVAEAGGSDSPELRAEVVAYTASRIEADLPATGFNRLSEIIGDDGPFILSAVTQWLEIDGEVSGDGLTPPLTELGVAERVAREHKGELFFVPERNDWFVWDGKRWTEDKSNQITTLVIQTIRTMSAESRAKLKQFDARLLETLELRAGKKKDEALEAFDTIDVEKATLAQKTLGFALSMETHAKITAVRNLTATLPELKRSLTELDKDPWLFNVRNGTLNLKTVCLQPHSREHYITKLADVNYEPAARAPKFDAFLREVLPDAELRAYVQRAHGYSLTGLTTEQCMFMCVGTGSNGKSILEKLRRAYMGDYLKTAPASTFLEKKGDGPRNDLAALAGARLVAVSETPRGKPLDETLIKSSTSGDVISARFLHKEYFEYAPQFKLWMSTNHRPIVEGGDAGIWRRLRVIPFDVQIAEDRQNVNLDRELIDEEIEGVFTWAVAGCAAWQRSRLGKPVLMQEEIADYKETSDPLADWFDACCQAGSGHSATAKEAWKSYTTHCAMNGTSSVDKQDFNDHLRHRTFKYIKVNREGASQVRGWRGFKLVSMHGRTKDKDIS